MHLSNFKRIVFTSDLLRVTDAPQGRASNPQRINVDWLRLLIGSQIEQLTGADSSIYLLDDFTERINRISVFRNLDIEFSHHGWASIYETLDDPVIENDIVGPLEGCLVVGFELPPYLIAQLDKRSISYIDFCIHPIRFLSDYVMGCRSNISSVIAAINATTLTQEDIEPDLIALQGRARRRLFSLGHPANGAVLFAGQMPVDASLIAEGRMLGIDDVINGLELAKIQYGHVYYKPHPHRKDVQILQEKISGLRDVHWLDMNIYDLLGCGRIQAVFSLSSSVLTEAQFFNVDGVRLSPRDSEFAASGLAADGRTRYTPINHTFLGRQFWDAALNGAAIETTSNTAFCLTRGILKESLNMKWGR